MLDPDAVFGALLAQAAGSTDAAGKAAWVAIAAIINAQVKKATVAGTATAVQAGAGTAPVTAVIT